MASVPPVKCLRGTIAVTAQAAEMISTAQDVPIAIGVYASNIGLKPEIWYKRASGEWVELTRSGSGPGIYEHPIALMYDQQVTECAIINQIGIKMWNVQQFQQWANDNIYAFFKDLVAKPSTNPTPGGEPSPVTLATPANMIDLINANLFDAFTLVDTNTDGIKEFHGK